MKKKENPTREKQIRLLRNKYNRINNVNIVVLIAFICMGFGSSNMDDSLKHEKGFVALYIGAMVILGIIAVLLHVYAGIVQRKMNEYFFDDGGD